MNPNHSVFYRMCVLLLATASVSSASAQFAGEVVASRGATTAQQGSEAPRLLGRAAKLNEGDVITTGRRSFVVMKMNDGTRMTLRPETVFKVESWQAKEREESAVIRLFKGGLRAISGAIAKRNPNAFRLETSIATIGIRGTTFDARLCDDGCKEDAEKYKTVAAKVSKVIGRAGFVKGTVSARRDEAGVQRNLTAGAPVYEGDVVKTENSSFVVILFKDRSRVTLRANSEFAVESFKFARSEDDSAVFRLFRGGLRAVSGLIGKRLPARVKYRTAIATIGIRGTGFDMYCQGSCESSSGSGSTASLIWEGFRDTLVPAANAANATDPGLVVAPWDDVVIIELPGGNLEVQQGQIVFVPADGSDPIFLPLLPINIDEPRPESIELDEDALLGAEEAEETQKGLYLACQEGYCIVGETPLGEGETAFTSEDGSRTVRFEIIPQFLTEDPYFKTVDIDPDVLDVLDVFGDPNTPECTF